MNLLVLSDLHLEHQPMQIEVPRDADAVVLAGEIAEGNIWAQEVFGNLPVFYVAGNREFYGGEIGTVAAAPREASAGTYVMLLEKAGGMMGDVRFLGNTLWSDFFFFAGDDDAEQGWSKAEAARYVPDFDSRISCFGDGYCVGLTPDITQRWHRQSAGWLARELARPPGERVVITHHAPSARSIPDCYPAIQPPRPTQALTTPWWRRPICGSTVMSIKPTTTSSAIVASCAIRVAMGERMGNSAPSAYSVFDHYGTIMGQRENNNDNKLGAGPSRALQPAGASVVKGRFAR